MKLSSPAFENNDFIPQKYTCDGKDVNPPLEITDAPEGTKSYVLIVDDPDAMTGVWDHWLVYNIKPDTNIIEEDSVPGIQLENSFAKDSYGGPCPPSGAHHYRFNLYALDTELKLHPKSSKQDLIFAMEGRILAQSELLGLYTRE
ncbi:MAG: hypothetical protein A2365_02950 [Candidatus Nealsonbacteria bacterium RIFOXYB1_FULL_40_15]|uniref:Kinase inhibitor n=2 Tax=Candidatus Nealsoniibacteriota TaxID=1817911 RepID=A0A1G2ERN3_9BACT|nr:MAG: hypothetical protein A2365_02950 [Candidatus Nealsonbacteria bacterium RIFOXYB1_FULL_40_15]OGZ28456.1 MAG: hypothetical protein A2427_02575 [Candidatus Nealsonbacteria bacterium RIFOXYC1_FULL_40_7]OGZ29867.1 MAG: hypothetical protein A2562_01985 [Candidatus Nealsonbacteria bacterium RIFOXYD1_FULL_39_11]